MDDSLRGASMELRWRNGVLTVGRCFCRDAYGIDLAWGNREAMGEVLDEGDTLFLDNKFWTIATGREVRKHGSVWRAVLARLVRH